MNKQELFQLIIKHQLPDRVSREAYCTCGAPIGDWATFYVDHLTNMIIEAMSKAQPCPSHCDECNPYRSPAAGTKTAAQLLKARHDVGLTAADIPKDYSTGAGEPEREALRVLVSEWRARAVFAAEQQNDSWWRGHALARREDADQLEVILDELPRREPEPREVTTIEELDALPVGTVIRDDEPAICEKSRDDGRWLVPGSSQRWKAAVLPAVILFTPSTERI